MKKKLLCFLSVCFFALPCSSCSNNNSFRESEPLSDKELGLTDFDMSVPTLKNFKPPFQLLTTGGSYDPLSSIKDDFLTRWTGGLRLLSSENALLSEMVTYDWIDLFSSSSYRVFDFFDFNRENTTMKFWYLPDVFYNPSTGSLKTKIIDIDSGYHSSSCTYHFSFEVSAVYSGNSFSYILDPRGATTTLFADEVYNYALFYGHNLFRVIRYDDEFPYQVYFDKYYIYFMSKNADFSLDYLKEFNAREDMHLFKL
jgi:hypothetical protein